MAESPPERSPGVLSRIGSWLSWGWGGHEPGSETQQEDQRETSGPQETGENSPALSRNAKHLRGGTGGTQVSSEQTRDQPRTSTPDQDKTEPMGRRRSGRRRRSSHGDVGGPQPKSPTSSQPASPAETSLATCPQTACADSALEEAGSCALECSGAEAASSGGREDVVPPGPSDSAVPTDPDMDEEAVVRMTESAESKRRSIKVSRSEKIFAKKVVVPSDVPLEGPADPRRPRPDDRARRPEDGVDGRNVKSGPQKGRIADKISLFERGAPKAGGSAANLRHLDLSPARNAAVRLAERGGTRAGSAPPNRTVKERAMDFSAGGEKLTLSSGHSKTAGSGEPKPTDQTDSKSHNATQSTPALSESDLNFGNKASGSLTMVLSPTDETPQVKSPTRTSSRSKKRRGREPLSPTSTNKQEMGQVDTASNIPPKPLLDAPLMDTKALKEGKSMDEKDRSECEASQAEVNTGRTGDKKQPVREGEGRKNRGTIVNTFGKPDPSVTNDEKPPSLEANSKDSRKDAMRSRESGTDIPVLPEKDDKNTPENDPKSERPSKPNHKSKDCLSEANDHLKTETETHKHRNEGDITTKQGGAKDTGRQEETLVKKQNEMDSTISPTEGGGPRRANQSQSESREEQKTRTASGKRDLQKPSTETRDKITCTEITSIVNGDLNSGGTENQLPVCLEQSGEKVLSSSHENALIPPSDENLSLRSVKNKPATPLPASANEKATPLPASANEKATPLPASENEKATPLSASANEKATPPTTSANEKATPLSASANEKATPPTTSANEKATPLPASENEKATPLSASANEKATPPTTSANEKATPLPASANEKATPLPASAYEKATPLPASANEKATPLSASANEKATPPTTSANEKATPLSASANEKATPLPTSANEKATPLPTSANEKATPPTASANEKATPPTTSANEKATPLPTSANEKATPLPTSANEKATPPTASANEKATPPTTSANEKATPLPTSANEKATPLPTSANEKATPLPTSANEKATPLPTSANEKATPLPTLANEKATPLPTSANEKATPLPTSAKEKATPLPTLANEKATPPTASANEKATPLPTSANEKATPLPTLANEKAMPPTASANEKATPLSASANEKATPLSASANEKATPLPASANEKATPLSASANEKATPLPASANEKATPPSASANEKATPLPASANEKATPLSASANEKATPLPASANEKATPPSASANEKATPLPASANEKATPPTASANEKATPLPASANEKATPLPASANEKATPPTTSANEKATPLLASANEKATPLPASANEKATPLPASANEKATPLPASENEKATPPTTSANEKATPLPASANEKATPPTASANEKATPPTASTNEKATPLSASANEKAMPPTASANEKATPPTASANEKATPLSASANEKATPLSASANEKATSLPASANEKATPLPASENEKATPPTTSANEKATPLPASANEKATPPTASANEKATLPPATTNETTSILPASNNKKTTPVNPPTKEHTPPASSSFPLTSTNGENMTPLPSSNEKTVLPPASIKEKTLPPHAKISHTLPSSPSSKSTDPATRKKEFTPKPFFLPQIPSTPGSSSLNRDSPSSWLDVDFQRPIRKKQSISEPKPKLSTSVSKTDLDTSGEFDPDDFIANVKRLAMPFNLPQRKHNQHRLQAPPPVLPAIREDRFEKPFDPEEFQHGLRKRREFILDLAPSSIAKSQDTEDKKEDSKPKWTKPERESILTRSLIFQRTRKESKPEEGEKEEGSDESTTEPLKTRSRLERCSIVSILRSPSRGRRMEFLSPTESPTDGLLSPTDAPGSTPPPQSQLAPTAESPEKVMVDEVLAKNDGRFTPSGSQVILKPTMTPDPKTTSRDQTIDTNDTGSKVVLKPTKEDGPVQTPDLKTTSSDPRVTNSPPTPSCTHSDSQAVLEHTENDGPTMKTDLKATSRDPAVTMLTDTNAFLHPSGTPTTSQVVLKPTKDTKDDGPTLTTSADPPSTILTDTKAPPLPSSIQTGSDAVLQPDRPALIPDLKTTTVDPIATLITEASAPPLLPSFEDIKLPSSLEKFLQKKPETSQPSNKIDPLVARESAFIPGLVDLNAAVGVADGKTQEVTISPAPQVPASQILPANLPNIPTARGIHRRPAKIVIFEHHQFNGQSFEFYRDQPDATQMQLSSVISVKVVRGCWILYEKPGFEGRCIALEEESVIELPNQWAEEGEEASTPLVIGSIRLAVRDYTPPRIELFTEPAGRGRSSEYLDVTEEVGSFSLPQNTGSIKVHSGLWLVYSDPGFQGLLAVMEAGEYPFPEDWGFPGPTVGSLRPLRMGLPKVEHPTAVKAVLFERAGLKGRSVEVHGDVFSLAGTQTDPDDHGLTCVESLKILGGLWVGYEREGFDGQQFLLEEGEYLDWSDWGGTGQKLLSLRPVLMDFSSPHMKMFSEPDFSERSVSLDLLEPLEDVSHTHFGPTTGSIEVLAGVWVAFEEPGLCGRQYVLEKGLYGSPEDWGAADGRIYCAVPVTLENLENSCHFQLEMFSEPGLGGTSVLLQDTLPTMPEGFSMRSCRVSAGSWQAFGRECFSGHQCVLEEGVYPDLRTMGFTHTISSVMSVRPAGHEFSLPSVVLFERSGLKGRRTLLKAGSVNLQLTDSCTRVSSILVEGGMWVLYEESNFRGSQFLLKPGAVPDWPKLSSWRRIGSLRPLIQKQTFFRLRNEEAGLMMSVTGSLGDVKLMRVQVSEEMGGANQVWAYQDGLLQCKWLPDCCVDVGSGVLMPGSRAVLSSEPGKPQQLWNISSDGIIHSNAKPHLVLEVKGGQQFDKRQIILNEFHPNRINQRWSLEIL